MTIWVTLKGKLFNRFFPHNKFMEANKIITVFSQGATETLCEAWERYKSMMRRCPNHSFNDLQRSTS